MLIKTINEIHDLIIIIILLILNLVNQSQNSNITLKINLDATESVQVYGRLSDCGNDEAKPDEIYINGNKRDEITDFYDLNGGENIIILIWTRTLTKTECLFNGCEEINKIDLSKLDTSQVESMYAMFDSCKSLTSLNFSTLDTSNGKKFCRYVF